MKRTVLWCLVGLLYAIVSTEPILAEGRETMTLNGLWEFVVDKNDVGMDKNWMLDDAYQAQVDVTARWDRKIIKVPSCWEEIVEDYEGVAWYRRTFKVPESWKGQAVRIRFDAVNYISEIWVNDQVVGYNEGGYTPFELHLEDLLKYGETNSMIVRVTGPAVTVERSGELRMNESPHWRGAITGGIWQPVTLIATDPVYLEDVFIKPDINTETATVQLTINHTDRTNRNLTADITVREWGGDGSDAINKTESVSVVPGKNVVDVSVKIANAKLWSPDTPNLYTIEVTLKDGSKTLDVVTDRFGMKEFTARNKEFYLNGEPFYLKAGFWEGLYPVTLTYPQDAEIVRKEIRLAKEAGFNTLRPWRKQPPAPILDLADEMGICIIDAPPIECMRTWPAFLPKMEGRIAKEVTGMVMRDRNHASVIIWEIFNEIMRPYLARYKHKMALVARSLDPTRIVVDESGGQFASDGSYAYMPFSSEPVLIQERHKYHPAPIDDAVYKYFNEFNEGDVLTIMSEYGYGSLPDLPMNMDMYRQSGNPIMPDYRITEMMEIGYNAMIDRYDLRKIWPNLSALCLESQEIAAIANKQVTEAIRLNPKFKGYALHAYTGGDWVIGAGILDLWRNPKASYGAMKEAQSPTNVTLRVTPSNVYAGKPVQLNVGLYSDVTVGNCRLKLEIRTPRGKKVYDKTSTVTVDKGIQSLVDESITLKQGGGFHIVNATLEQNGAAVTKNTYRFWVMGDSELRVPKQPVALLEEKALLTPKLQKAGMQVEAFDGNNSNLPVFVTAWNANNRNVYTNFVKLFDYVRRGGVAVLLNPPATLATRIGSQGDVPTSRLVRTGLLPVDLKLWDGVGNWRPVNHYVHDHPVFEGLPVNCFMNEAYQNIMPRQMLLGVNAKPIAGGLTYTFDHNYRGVKDFIGGADLAVVPYGKGKLILSMLRLVDKFGNDPAVDRIMYNLTNFAASQITKVDPVNNRALQGELDTYLVKYDALAK